MTNATKKRFLKYAITGLTVTVVQSAFQWLFSHWLSSSTAFVLAFTMGVVTNYTLNRFWALKSRRTDTTRQAGEYMLTVTGSLVASFLLFRMAVDFLYLNQFLAVLITSPIVSILVFLVFNFRVFRA